MSINGRHAVALSSAKAWTQARNFWLHRGAKMPLENALALEAFLALGDRERASEYAQRLGDYAFGQPWFDDLRSSLGKLERAFERRNNKEEDGIIERIGKLVRDRRYDIALHLATEARERSSLSQIELDTLRADISFRVGEFESAYSLASALTEGGPSAHHTENESGEKLRLIAKNSILRMKRPPLGDGCYYWLRRHPVITSLQNFDDNNQDVAGKCELVIQFSSLFEDVSFITEFLNHVSLHDRELCASLFGNSHFRSSNFNTILRSLPDRTELENHNLSVSLLRANRPDLIPGVFDGR